MGEIEPRCVRLWNLSSILHRIPVFHLLNHLLVLGEEIQIMLNLESENHLILSWKRSGMWTCPWTSKSINSNFQDWRLHCKALYFQSFFFLYPNNSSPYSVHGTESMPVLPVSWSRDTLSLLPWQAQSLEWFYSVVLCGRWGDEERQLLQLTRNKLRGG